MYVGGRVLRADSLRVLMLALEMNFRNDMVDQNQMSGRLQVL